MPDTIRIKRRNSGAVGAPASLANAELAYNETDHTLYYGEGGTPTAATSIVPIAGQGLAATTNPPMDGTAAPGASAKWARGDHVHPTDTTRAPLNSPAFTGTPTAPTPAPGDNDTSIATTAFVTGAVAASTAGVSSFNGRTGTVTLVASDVTGIGGALIASPVFTGNPQAPTPTVGDNDTSIATTAFVQAAIATVGGGNVSNSGTPVNGQLARWLDATHIQGIDASTLGFAPLASPTFTGDPKAPTPATADNDTSIATTAFVKAQGYLVSTDLSAYALLASPLFTGDPRAPTPATADNDTSIATTAFVKAQGYVTGGPYQPIDADLTAIAGLTGINVIYYRSAADTWSGITIGTGLSFSGGTLTNTVSIAGLAPLASPIFTGDPQAPTPATADNDTSIATTAFVKAQGYVTGGPYQPLDAELTALASLPSSIDTAPYFTGSGTAALMTVTIPARALLDDTSTAAMLTTLGAQPVDADLTAIAALTGTNTIYYRSIADVWSPVTMGTNMTFSGGTLSAVTGVTISDTPPVSPANGTLWWESDTAKLWISYNDGTSIQWVAVSGGPATAGALQYVYAENNAYISFTTSSGGIMDSVPQQTDGTEILQVTIQPRNAASTLRIEFTAPCSAGAGINFWGALFQDNSAAAIASVPLAVPSTNSALVAMLIYKMLAGATVPTTFKIRMGNYLGGATPIYINGSATQRVLGGTSRATISVTEYV